MECPIKLPTLMSSVCVCVCGGWLRSSERRTERGWSLSFRHSGAGVQIIASKLYSGTYEGNKLGGGGVHVAEKV